MESAAVRASTDTVLAETHIAINTKQILLILPEILMIITNCKEFYA